MRSAGTSTSVTPRKENKSFTRYMGGCSEVCFTMRPTASVTAAWNITPSACRPARFTRTSWPDWNITPGQDRPAVRGQMQAVPEGRGVQQRGGRIDSAFPPCCFSNYLCCLRLDANCLGMGCLGQFDLQNAIFQDRAHLRAVNLRRQINDP